MKILVTGSAGFIGSHFAKYFSRKGSTVYGLDQVPSPTGMSRYLVDFLQTDMAESSAVETFVKKYSIEATVHCAALCLVAESVEKPDLYHEVNVVKAEKLVRAVTRGGAKIFLFSSTAAVYGQPDVVPIPEEHPKQPINPYGASKLEFENRLAAMERQGLLTLGIFRYFNAAGADPEGELGERHDPESHLIPNAIDAALGLIPGFELFGTDYPTRDGTCVRDFIHVWDLADAHYRLVERMASQQKGGTFNLGTGNGYTVKEVLDEIDLQTGKKLPRIARPRRPGDPSMLIANPSKAQRDLNWKPGESDLARIVSTALAWRQRRADKGV